MTKLKSRILKFLPEELIYKLDSLRRNVFIPDNNQKADKIVTLLDEFNVDYIELGVGTNRYAALIDGYVFKIALDNLGVQDNWAEFSLTQELQPFVIKVYECNGLISVSEYVTVISKEEFISRKDEIRCILGKIADKYLLGDIGTVTKNFMNWGYRDNDELTALDFAYIYRLQGGEMICGHVDKSGNKCDGFLEYDENFYKIRCPKCGHEYLFTEIRVRIDKKYETGEVNYVKDTSYKLNVSEVLIDESTDTQDYNTTNEKENHIMPDKNVPMTDEEFDENFAQTVEFLKSMKGIPVIHTSDDIKPHSINIELSSTEPARILDVTQVIDSSFTVEDNLDDETVEKLKKYSNSSKDDLNWEASDATSNIFYDDIDENDSIDPFLQDDSDENFTYEEPESLVRYVESLEEDNENDDLNDQTDGMSVAKTVICTASELLKEEVDDNILKYTSTSNNSSNDTVSSSLTIVTDNDSNCIGEPEITSEESNDTNHANSEELEENTGDCFIPDKLNDDEFIVKQEPMQNRHLVASGKTKSSTLIINGQEITCVPETIPTQTKETSQPTSFVKVLPVEQSKSNEEHLRDILRGDADDDYEHLYEQAIMDRKIQSRNRTDFDKDK